MKFLQTILFIFILTISSMLYAEEVDGIAAIVGNQIILKSEIETNYEELKASSALGEMLQKRTFYDCWLRKNS